MMQRKHWNHGLADGTNYFVFEATANTNLLQLHSESGEAVDIWQYLVQKQTVLDARNDSTFYIGTDFTVPAIYNRKP